MCWNRWSRAVRYHDVQLYEAMAYFSRFMWLVNWPLVSLRDLLELNRHGTVHLLELQHAKPPGFEVGLPFPYCHSIHYSLFWCVLFFNNCFSGVSNNSNNSNWRSEEDVVAEHAERPVGLHVPSRAFQREARGPCAREAGKAATSRLTSCVKKMYFSFFFFCV